MIEWIIAAILFLFHFSKKIQTYSHFFATYPLHPDLQDLISSQPFVVITLSALTYHPLCLG